MASKDIQMQNYTTTISDKDEHTYDQIKMKNVVIPTSKPRITIAFLILILCLVSAQFGLMVHLSTLYAQIRTDTKSLEYNIKQTNNNSLLNLSKKTTLVANLTKPKQCITADATELIASSESCVTPVENRQQMDTARNEILKTIADVTRQDQGITCNTGWKRFNDHCYYFNFYKKTWFDAERYCRTQNSFLAYIRDDTENGWIQYNMNITDLWWVGATDWNTGKWIWSYDFAPLNYTKWKKGEPNDYKGTEENCCNMYGYGEWNDRKCTLELPFVCKDTEST